MDTKWKGIAYSKEILMVENAKIIIDFYNIYCTYISFHKTRVFSLQTFKDCMEFVLKDFSHPKNCLFVSKVIYEVPEEEICYFIRKYNINYVIIKDDYAVIEKGLNRERDDYVCILLSSMLKEKNYILSNDQFNNYKSLICNVKPLTLIWLSNVSGKSNKNSLSKEHLRETRKDLLYKERLIKKNKVNYILF